LGTEIAKTHGITRRRFFKTAGGMAAAFVAMNEVYAKNSQPFFEVLKGEEKDLELAQARADGLKGQFIMDMHTHFLRAGTPITACAAQRGAPRGHRRRRWWKRRVGPRDGRESRRPSRT